VLEPGLWALAAQQFDLSQLEVVVVYNGPEPGPSWSPAEWPFELTVIRSAAGNVGAARNAGFARARGEWLLLLNDDVVAEPGLIAAHLAAHAQLGRPAMVLGRTDWQRYANETVFDRMIQTTSMIFFYDQMRPESWYDFRHAWTLNLSLPRHFTERVQFDENLKPVNFDDLEWAFRLQHGEDLRVWYTPAPRATHHHRYTFEQYLDREHALGRMAVLLWRCNPACYQAIYGTPLDQDEVDYCHQFVTHESRREPQIRQTLDAIIARRPDELSTDPAVQNEMIQALYLAHLPLKRLAFRRGVLAAVWENVARPTPATNREAATARPTGSQTA
jgi:hypothetical protein